VTALNMVPLMLPFLSTQKTGNFILFAFSSHTVSPSYLCLTSEDADVTWLDGYWNSFHREVVDMMLPYNRTYDCIAWPGSHGYIRMQGHSFWPHFLFGFTKTVMCRNGVHRKYQGQYDVRSWGPTERWLGSLSESSSIVIWHY
jgi:hypothetical protein